MDQVQFAAYVAVGVGGSLLALAGVLTVFLRSRAARDRVRLELFDRRWRVYAASAHAMDRALSDRPVTEDDMHEFFRGISGDEFLFRKDVSEFLSEMGRRLDDLRGEDPEAEGAAERVAAARRWFAANADGLRPLFARYLDLGGR